MADRHFCAQISRQADDPFIGTAAWVDTWLLIEYCGMWKRDEVEQSLLPQTVKDWVFDLREQAVRTQLIKRGTQQAGSITVFVAITKEQCQALYRFQFERYEDLLALDLTALREGDDRYHEFLCSEPLFLVCTHGKHDACCAKFGLPVYQELERLAGPFTWQSSHVGGDKFAANLLCFPHGIYYGRVAIAEAERIIAADQQDQLYLPKYRGRTCYPPVAQAADYFLRERTETYDLQAFRLLEIRRLDEELWQVCFEAQDTGSQHSLFVKYQANPVPAYQTICCGDGKNVIHTYYLHQHEVIKQGVLF